MTHHCIASSQVSFLLTLVVKCYFGTGATFHFLIILMGIFWFLHLCHIYMSILFPLKLNFLKCKTWSRGLHVTEVTGAIMLSAIGPMVVLISNNKYNITSLPPLICFPASIHLSIYTIFIPLVIMFTTGVCITITILWTLIKVGSYTVVTADTCTMIREIIVKYVYIL